VKPLQAESDSGLRETECGPSAVFKRGGAAGDMPEEWRLAATNGLKSRGDSRAADSPPFSLHHPAARQPAFDQRHASK
jgi:hypothetical protein